jgi:hypothetical protein
MPSVIHVPTSSGGFRLSGSERKEIAMIELDSASPRQTWSTVCQDAEEARNCAYLTSKLHWC